MNSRLGELDEEFPMIQPISQPSEVWTVKAKLEQARREALGVQMLIENAQRSITHKSQIGELYLRVLRDSAERLQEAIGYLLEGRYDRYTPANNPDLDIF